MLYSPDSILSSSMAKNPDAGEFRRENVKFPGKPCQSEYTEKFRDKVQRSSAGGILIAHTLQRCRLTQIMLFCSRFHRLGDAIQECDLVITAVIQAQGCD